MSLVEVKNIHNEKASIFRDVLEVGVGKPGQLSWIKVTYYLNYLKLHRAFLVINVYL